MDIEKLTPLPLYRGVAGSVSLVLDNPISTDSEGRVASFREDADSEAFLLMRSDLGVKLRRGWHTEKHGDEWRVVQLFIPEFWQDAALVESWAEAVAQKGHDVGLLTKAEAWYIANIEAKEGGQ